MWTIGCLYYGSKRFSTKATHVKGSMVTNDFFTFQYNNKKTDKKPGFLAPYKIYTYKFSRSLVFLLHSIKPSQRVTASQKMQALQSIPIFKYTANKIAKNKRESQILSKRTNINFQATYSRDFSTVASISKILILHKIKY